MSDFRIEKSESERNQIKGGGFIALLVLLCMVMLILINWFNILFIATDYIYMVLAIVAVVSVPILIRLNDKISSLNLGALIVPSDIHHESELSLMQLGGQIYHISLDNVEYMFVGTKRDLEKSDMSKKYSNVLSEAVKQFSWAEFGAAQCVVLTKGGEVKVFPRVIWKGPRNDVSMRIASQQSDISLENCMMYIDDYSIIQKMSFLIFCIIFIFIIFYFGIE